jgi:hypothetical protein
VRIRSGYNSLSVPMEVICQMQYPVWWFSTWSANGWQLLRSNNSFKWGNPLWLTGVDALITKKYILKCLKISKKNLDIHLDILCSFMKIREKSTFFVASVKKTNFSAPTLLFTWPFFIFFIHATKNVFSSQNFVGKHKLFRYTIIIFCLIFLTF